MYISFKNWISKFQNDNTPTGDLARDILEDSFFPHSNDKQSILNYLRDKPPAPDVIDTFNKAWQAYLLTR